MSAIVKENDRMVSVHFESILELMDFEPSSDRNKRGFKHLMNDVSLQSRQWLGFENKSNKDVINHALLGDEYVYNLAKDKMHTLNTGHVYDKEQNIRVVKRERLKNGFGDELDIHKVYQGQLDKAWTRTRRIEVDHKHHLVTLFMSIGGESRVRAEDTIWRTIIIMKLVSEIEKAGKNVKVIVGGFVSRAMIGSHKNLTTSITVKKYNETLSPERLAAMSHIGFYRVFGFAAKRCQDLPIVPSEGHPDNINYNRMPIHLREEIDMGHTKPVFISRTQNLSQAQQEIKNAYAQMASFK